MKRKWKALASLCLALALMLCLSLPVWAEGDARIAQDSKATITLTWDTADSNVTANAYKVIRVDYQENTATSPSENNEAPKDPEFYWVDEVVDWVSENGSAYIDGETKAVTKAFSEAGAEDLKAFFNKMAAAIGGSISITGQSLTIVETTGTLETEMGGYLILVTGGTRIYNPVFVSLEAEYKDGSWTLEPVSAEVKSETLGITKTVNKANETSKEETTAYMGETLSFTLEADVPNYPANAQNKTYAISDTLPAGMTLDESSIVVKGVTFSSDEPPVVTEIPLDNTSNQIWNQTKQRPDNATSTSFTLNFTYDEIKTYDKIRVTYTANVNGFATIGPDGNINHADLDYSRDPHADTDYLLNANDSTTTYSYGIIVTKKDEDTNDLLPGAVFTLRAADEDGNFNNGGQDIKFEADAGNSGTYRRAADQNGSGVTELSVSNSGVLTLSGLDVGTYYLTEVKAPDGYNVLSAPIRVEITDNDDKDVNEGNGDNSGPNGKPEYTNEAKIEVEAADGYVPLTVINTTGFTLPTTGGMGTVLFTAAGIALMGLGLAALVLYLRRRSDK